jgi:iron complex transport system substrate-binding protein
MPGSGRPYHLLLLISCLWFASQTRADVSVTDDMGVTISLEHSARRIIALSPHITELLFAIGAGKQVVGAVAYSDYPAEASTIPRVGDASRIDMERLMVLQPDLVVGWASGNSQAALANIRAFAVPLYLAEPATLEGIAENLQELGVLSGNVQQAAALAGHYRQQLQVLRRQYSQKKTVRVFYQVWQQPLLTFSSRHLVDQVIRLCGGENIFARLPGLTPQVSIEAVVASNPDVIIAGDYTDGAGLRAYWGQWQGLKAVKRKHIYAIHPDLLHRQTPRLLQGAAELCSIIDTVRNGGY